MFCGNPLYKYGEQIKGKSIMMDYGIYNNRLFNTPAPIGYGVTTPQDLSSYFAMGDRFYTTNFGMSTQYGIFNGGYDPLVYKIAQNPGYYASTNPMLIGLTGNTPIQGTSFLDGIAADRLAKQAPQILAALENQLQQGLDSDKLTEEQKQKVQEKLNEVKELVEKFKTALNNPNVSAQELYALEEAMHKLKAEVGQLGQELAAALQSSSAQASQNTENDENPSEVQAQVTADDKNIPESVLESYCHGVEACIAGAGTDEDTLRTELQKLNKDNVVEVIKHWEETRGKHSENEGMIARILKDLNDGEQKEMVPFIRDAFVARAEELGIYNEIKKEVAAVNQELLEERTFWGFNWLGGQDDDVIKNNLMVIYDKIVAKEANNAAEVKQKEDDKKAEAEAEKVEAEKKEANKAQEAKDLFLNDMREILGDDKAEISDKVQYKDGKFTIRIMGEDYFGKDYNALAKAIKDAGFEPEQYLKKQPLKVAA